MCSFVTNCLDISKLTDEEKKCIEDYLQDRRNDLEARINALREQIIFGDLDDLRARLNKVNEASRLLSPRRY